MTPSNREIRDHIIRTDFFVFVQWMFTILYPDKPFITNVAVETMCATVTDLLDGSRAYPEEDNKVIFNLPPRILKSFILSVCYPLYVLGRDPSETIICVSYSDDISRQFAELRRRALASPKFKAVFPKLCLSGNRHNEVTTTEGGFIYATSVGGVLTGRGANHFIIDDPIKAGDVMSDARREGVNEWLQSTLPSRADDKRFARWILVMQRLHVDDPAGVLSATLQWYTVRLPAIAERKMVIPLMYGRTFTRETGHVLNPELEPLNKLEELRSAMGEYNFQAQYQQSPAPIQGNLFKVQCFVTCDTMPIVGRGDMVVQSWDPALSEKENSDYTVGVTLLVRQDQYYVLEIVRGRMGFPALRQAIIDARTRYPTSTVIVEHSVSGISVHQDLKASHRLHVIPIKVQGDKTTRAHRITPVLEAGRIFLPRRAGWLAPFLAEMRAFPMAGSHDDQVDALVQGINWVEDRKRYPTAQFGTY
jgi:predicted phage terminase large subunit-like protein